MVLSSRDGLLLSQSHLPVEGHSGDGTCRCLHRDAFREEIFAWYAAKWTATLSNSVAPVSALVSDSGRYVVTFDNWHQVGYGNDVVAVYDGSNGKPLLKYRLEDLLNNEELCQVKCSVSSRWWARGRHELDESGDRLILHSVSAKAIDLKTGKITSADTDQLGAAQHNESRGLQSLTSVPCRSCQNR